MKAEQVTLKTLTLILLLLALGSPLRASAGDSQASAEQKGPEGKSAPAVTVTGIRFSFKLDPRLRDSTYGGDLWVSPPTYMGANAQATVEAKAQVIGAQGQPAKASLEWIPSDPDMVTVSPSQGDQVKITVHRAGESKLKVACQGFSRELVVKAKYFGKAIQVQITPLEVEKKPDGVAAAQEAPALKGQKEKLSYAVGMNLAKALQKQSVAVDADVLMQGFKDALSGSKTLMTNQEVHATLIGVQTELRNQQAALQKERAEKNKKEGEAFLTENKKKEGVVSLASGLQYKIVKAGEGNKPTANDVVVCHYRGTLIDGTEFDNSYNRKGPVSFPLKAVIKGWAEALQLMPVGSKWQLFVPSGLAYGERGAGRKGNIGPNATLIFEVELLSVHDASGVRASALTKLESSKAQR